MVYVEAAYVRLCHRCGSGTVCRNIATVSVTVTGPEAVILRLRRSWSGQIRSYGYACLGCDSGRHRLRAGLAPYPGAEWIDWGDVGVQNYFSFELPYGSAYYVWVYAYNSAGWSDPSNLGFVILDGPPSLQVAPSTLNLKVGEAGILHH